MKQILLLITSCISITINVHAQNVGLGTTTPTAGLHLVSDNGFVAKGTIGSGNVINESGAGSRFIFAPRKGAIRGGYLDGTGQDYWNDVNTGFYSVGFGYNTKASGTGAVAIGQNASATGINSTAIGYGCSADVANSVVLSGVSSYAKSQFSVAIGNYTSANNYGSVAIGRNVNAGYPVAGYGENNYAIGIGDNTSFSTGGHYATGDRAFVIGNNGHSVGDRSFAIGNDCIAGQLFENSTTGRYSFALGNTCTASGIFSFAFGNNANTNGHQGSMVLGSRTDGVPVLSPGDFHFLAQFAGGCGSAETNVLCMHIYGDTDATCNQKEYLFHEE